MTAGVAHTNPLSVAYGACGPGLSLRSVTSSQGPAATGGFGPGLFHVCRSGAYTSGPRPNVQATPWRAVRVVGGTRSQ